MTRAYIDKHGNNLAQVSALIERQDYEKLKELSKEKSIPMGKLIKLAVSTLKTLS